MPAPTRNGYPDNPVLARVWRGDAVESVHRGAWVLVDSDGTVVEGGGAFEHPIYARSTIKALQALPLVESGAADRFGFEEPELALSCASHNAEECHVAVVRGMLEKIDLGEDALRCGAQVPDDPGVRSRLRSSGAAPLPIHNNCSGKHAGFLALARHLGADPASYLDPAGDPQLSVRQAVAEMCGIDADGMPTAIDGCSAPTFRTPLVRLGHAFARLANPDGLPDERAAACRRLVAAVRAHPDLVAGNHKRIDTDILRATDGRLFPKLGAEAVYLVGEVGGGRALALKIDDGELRGMHRVLIGLLERFEMLTPAELAALEKWRDPVLKNRAGLEVGREELAL